MQSSQDWGPGRNNEVKLTVSQSQLERIIRGMERFSLDAEGAARPFSKKLQAQQGWTEEFTARAIDEYKRFMVLAAVSSNEVTPSKIVDEVWHLHLQYSRSYRDEMCKQILGKHIDHNPGDGADGENSHYSDQYLKTLLLYMTVFGEKPPSDIWQFSEFDKAGLTKGIAMTESRRDREKSRSSSGDSDSSMFIFGDTSLPARPSEPASPLHKDSEQPATSGGTEPSSGGFWSSIREFFGFGPSNAGVEKGSSSSPPTAEVNSPTGHWSFFESFGLGSGSDGTSSSSSSCSSASSCSSGGSSCGGGGCGGGGCGGS
jgi:hypothetical protein